jgi:hypothetical protein
MESSKWQIGAIRWVQNIGAEKTLIGIEILSDTPKPIGANIFKGQEQKTYSLRCLLLYNSSYDEAPKAIITPVIPFKSNDKIGIFYGHSDTPQKAIIHNEIETTGNYKILGEGLIAQTTFTIDGNCSFNYQRNQIPMTFSRDVAQNDTDLATLIHALVISNNVTRDYVECKNNFPHLNSLICFFSILLTAIIFLCNFRKIVLGIDLTK